MGFDERDKQFFEDQEKKKPWFRENMLAAGEEVTLTIVDMTRNDEVNNPNWHSVKDPDGKPLGWNWRFTIEGAEPPYQFKTTWDCNRPRIFNPVAKWLDPAGDGTQTPVRVKIKHLDVSPDGKTKYVIEKAD